MSATGFLSIDGLTFTGSATINGLAAITGYAPVNMTNVLVTSFSSPYYFFYSTSSPVTAGHFENIIVRDSTSYPSPFIHVSATPSWTAVNMSFTNVRPTSSAGIIHFATEMIALAVTFGGDIKFINCITSSSQAMDSAITATTYHTAFNIYSKEGNPSNFVIQNSDISLFLLHANPNAGSPVHRVEIGSVDANAPISGHPTDKMRFIFQIDMWDFDNGYFLNLRTNSIYTVLGDITSNGMGIISRGYGYTSTPNDMTNNAVVKINGDLNFTIDGNVAAAFRMVWPVDVYANSINAKLIPDPILAIVPNFIEFVSTQFTGVSAHVNFIVTEDFVITSTNTPYTWTDKDAPSSAPLSPVPTASTPEDMVPYSPDAPFRVNAVNLAVNVVSKSFTIANFSRVQAESFNSGYRSAAISVTSSLLNITTTEGDIVFYANQNTAGIGGALYVGSDTPACILATASTGRIIFRDNVAYYGGAVFIEPAATGLAVQFISDSIELSGNTAISGGGIAILPHHYVPALFPSSTNTRLGGNGAGEFGCLFAFNLSSESSDVSDPTCASGSYFADVFSDNYRLGSSYDYSENCYLYEQICVGGPPVSPINPVPNPNPTAAPVSVPFAAPVDIPVPVVPSNPNCPQTTNIPSGSVCANGVYLTSSQSFIDYIANGTSSKPAVVGAPIVITGGNVSLPEITVANVLRLAPGVAMISSNSCVSISTVSVSLSKDDIDQIDSAKSASALLIQSSCSQQGTNILAVGASPKKSCQKTKVTPKSTANSLQATFTLSSSKCNVWWIVLVSVLGGILILLIVAIVVIRSLPEHHRRRIQPFYKTKDTSDLAKPRAYTNVE